MGHLVFLLLLSFAAFLVPCRHLSLPVFCVVCLLRLPVGFFFVLVLCFFSSSSSSSCHNPFFDHTTHHNGVLQRTLHPDVLPCAPTHPWSTHRGLCRLQQSALPLFSSHRTTQLAVHVGYTLSCVSTEVPYFYWDDSYFREHILGATKLRAWGLVDAIAAVAFSILGIIFSWISSPVPIVIVCFSSTHSLWHPCVHVCMFVWHSRACSRRCWVCPTWCSPSLCTSRCSRR